MNFSYDDTPYTAVCTPLYIIQKPSASPAGSSLHQKEKEWKNKKEE